MSNESQSENSSVRSGGYSRLKLVSTGEEFELSTPSLCIGRGAGADIIINNPTLSLKHARIFYTDGGWFIEDLHSVNGVSVNGRQLAPSAPCPLGEHSAVTLALSVRFHFFAGVAPACGEAPPVGDGAPIPATAVDAPQSAPSLKPLNEIEKTASAAYAGWAEAIAPPAPDKVADNPRLSFANLWKHFIEDEPSSTKAQMRSAAPDKAANPVEAAEPVKKSVPSREPEAAPVTEPAPVFEPVPVVEPTPVAASEPVAESAPKEEVRKEAPAPSDTPAKLSRPRKAADKSTKILISVTCSSAVILAAALIVIFGFKSKTVEIKPKYIISYELFYSHVRSVSVEDRSFKVTNIPDSIILSEDNTVDSAVFNLDDGTEETAYFDNDELVKEVLIHPDGTKETRRYDDSTRTFTVKLDGMPLMTFRYDGTLVSQADDSAGDASSGAAFVLPSGEDGEVADSGTLSGLAAGS